MKNEVKETLYKPHSATATERSGACDTVVGRFWQFESTIHNNTTESQ